MEVNGASFVWADGMPNAELRLTTDEGCQTFILRDHTVILLFEQMWHRRVALLATQSAESPPE